MDSRTTAEMANIFQKRANEIVSENPELAKELRMGAHLLSLYAALEDVYRAKLTGELESIADQVNKLFKNVHIG